MPEAVDKVTIPASTDAYAKIGMSMVYERHEAMTRGSSLISHAATRLVGRPTGKSSATATESAAMAPNRLPPVRKRSAE